MAKMKTGTKILIGTGVGLGTLYGISVISRNMMLEGMNTYVAVTPTEKVSVIIKNLNEEGTIGRCIESLLNQSVILENPNMFDITLVDGGSTDGSLEIAQKYPIKAMVTQKGLLHQMNEGIRNTAGAMIVLTDSDSYYPPYWLGKLLKVFSDEPDVVLASTPYLTYDESEDLLWSFIALVGHARGLALGAGTAVKRTVFEQTGLFNEDYECVVFRRVQQEAEFNFADRARTVGRVYYQQNNPFITTNRRLALPVLEHECIHNPKNMNCPFAQEVGVTRF